MASELQEALNHLVELELMTAHQMRMVLEELPPETNTNQLYGFLERRQILTGLQITKLERGDETGYILGRFKLLYKVSAGTFARVYRGVDRNNNAVVAVKVLRSRHTYDPENIRQFRREAKLTEALKHPNIVHTLEVGIDELSKQHYIAMEYVEGSNLRELLKIRGKYGADETLKLGQQMISGLEYALDMGITHRDIKPTNVLVGADGQIKWVDFGLAGFVETKGDKEKYLTDARTVDYAGLEKATGAPKGDPRSDIFFTGAILYQMLTGTTPLAESKDRNDRMRRGRFDNISKLADNQEVPRELADIVDKMLEFRPADRYQNYADILADMQATVKRRELATSSSAMEAASKPRVLIVHNSPKVQDILRNSLTERGYQVVLTADIGRAIQLCQLKPADALIVDAESAGQEGIRTYARMIKQFASKGRMIPTVFLCHPHDRGWTSVLDSTMSVVLEKPVQLGPVYQALKRVLPINAPSTQQSSAS